MAHGGSSLVPCALCVPQVQGYGFRYGKWKLVAGSVKNYTLNATMVDGDLLCGEAGAECCAAAGAVLVW